MSQGPRRATRSHRPITAGPVPTFHRGLRHSPFLGSPEGAVDLRNEAAASLPPSQRLRAEELEHQCYLTGFVTCE